MKRKAKAWKEVNTVKYKKDKNGVVHLSGKVKAGKPQKLPKGCRPPKQQELPMEVEKAKPTLEQLSEMAAITLQSLRNDIERTAQREYEARKFLEVKRLAEEHGLTEKLIIAHIQPKEEIKVRR